MSQFVHTMGVAPQIVRYFYFAQRKGLSEKNEL